jgi:hypothetical protein
MFVGAPGQHFRDLLGRPACVRSYRICDRNVEDSRSHRNESHRCSLTSPFTCFQFPSTLFEPMADVPALTAINRPTGPLFHARVGPASGMRFRCSSATPRVRQGWRWWRSCEAEDWAGKTLPALQHHLQMAEQMNKNRSK